MIIIHSVFCIWFNTAISIYVSVGFYCHAGYMVSKSVSIPYYFYVEVHFGVNVYLCQYYNSPVYNHNLRWYTLIPFYCTYSTYIMILNYELFWLYHKDLFCIACEICSYCNISFIFIWIEIWLWIPMCLYTTSASFSLDRIWEVF